MKPTLLKFTAIFVAIAGFLSGVVGILSAPHDLRVPALFLLLAIAFMLCLWLILSMILQHRSIRLAVPSVTELEEAVMPYSVEQATLAEIGWIAQLETQVYSSADAIPRRTLEEWYTANPHGFFIVRAPDGRKLGHLDILPLKP